eukprot:Nk52_evm51s914 gene=Nk52_evmTU51s914
MSENVENGEDDYDMEEEQEEIDENEIGKTRLATDFLKENPDLGPKKLTEYRKRFDYLRKSAKAPVVLEQNNIFNANEGTYRFQDAWRPNEMYWIPERLIYRLTCNPIVHKNLAMVLKDFRYANKRGHLDSGKLQFTLEELSKYNTEKCSYVAINGVVYDITDWAAMHPGGESVIRMFAGKEVSDVFSAFHDKAAWSQLKSMRVGVLTDHLETPAYVKEFRELNSKFRRMGLYDINHQKYWRLIAGIVCVYCIFFSVMFSGLSDFYKLLVCPILPLIWIQSGFLGHDLGHNQMFGKKQYNEGLGFVFGTMLMGLSMDWWKSTHNTHHAVTNSIDLDPDTQYLPIFAISSHLVKDFVSKYHKKVFVFDYITREIVKRQHLLMFPVMAFARVNIYIQGIKHLVMKKSVKNRTLEIFGLAFFFWWYIQLTLSLSTWYACLAFFVITQTGNMYLHTLLAVNHFTQEKYAGLPIDSKFTLEEFSKTDMKSDFENGEIDNRVEKLKRLERGMSKHSLEPKVQVSDFYITQLRTTMNLEYPSCLLYGGLHHQIEHHMYPFIPHYNLTFAAPLVKDICQRHGLPYRTVPDWTTGIAALYSHLAKIAYRAKDFTPLGEIFHTVG